MTTDAAEPLAPVFLLDERPVDESTFVSRAIDPAASVAIDACAGSGKTTLLVRRIVRCLLDGAAPDSILAITFTRAAAQEMQVRVRAMLRRLAFAPDPAALAILRDELHLGARAPAVLADARTLYERTLTDRRGLDITTFHRWFWQLARRGTRIGSSEPVSELAEREVELLDAAWLGWLDQRREPGREALAAAFDRTVRLLGASATETLMRSFVAQRTEWIASLGHATQPAATPADGTPDRAGFDDEPKAIAQAAASHRAQIRRWADAARTEIPSLADWSDERLHDAGVDVLAQASGIVARIRFFAALLAQSGVVGKRIAGDFGAALDRIDAGVPSDWLDWWGRLVKAATTGSAASPRSIRWSQKDFASHVDAAGGADHLQAEWQSLCDRIVRVSGLCADRLASLPINLDLLVCSVSFACAYQALKRRRGVLDFVDLEAIAARLLRDDGLSAYLQLRLDRRYRHLLFDEFQDTSSLQWTVIGEWLTSYAGAGVRPSIFVVGDPKQSIYRFRRAESRVFTAACALLREAFAATVLKTATTRRNVTGIMTVLNASFAPAMPNFVAQATLAPAATSLVWRLPRPGASPVTGDTGAKDRGEPEAAAADEDWLTRLRGDDDNHFRAEGLAIGAAILAARETLAAGGRPVPYREIIVLARGRTGFAEYERALRSLDIPVVSDRKGGLLDSLEAMDLIALLRIARDPDDDLSLAQVLRSPLIGLSAERIGALALQRERLRTDTTRASLWRCLGGDDGLRAAHARLADWLSRARRLPIHDFLDSVIAEVDAEAAYAGCVDPAQREIVVGNLQAMVGLALDHDGGRYPGIARFLHQMGALGRLDDRDAPDEGRPIEHDAVRLMTVHGAKGLEADLVVIADAGHPKRADGARFAVDWPPDAALPRETWFRLDSGHRGYLSRRLDQRERELAEIEDWNLLYVAATRARLGLIVSVAPRRNSPADTWYDRLSAIPVRGPSASQGSVAASGPAGDLEPGGEAVRSLRLPFLPIGERLADQRSTGPAGPSPIDDPRAGDATTRLKAGTALHRALELMSTGLDDARVEVVIALEGLGPALAARALALAHRVRALPALLPAFADGAGRDEFELFDADGRLLRIDRLARVGGAVWIIDYKWSIAPAERAGYLVQLDGYRAAIAGLAQWPAWLEQGGRAAALRTVLVDATAGQVEFDPR